MATVLADNWGEWVDRRSSQTTDLHRSHTRTIRVRTVAGETSHDVLAAVGVPLVNDPHPGDPFAYAVSVDPQQDQEHLQLWLVRVEYATKSEPPSLTAELPTSRPTVFAPVRFQRRRKPVVIDLDGLAIKNSAGTPYSPIEIDEVDQVLEFRKCVAKATVDLHFPLWKTYLYAVNTDVFLVDHPAKSCRIEDIDAGELRFEKGLEFYELKYVIHVREVSGGVTDPSSDPWQTWLLDEGPEYFDPVVAGVLRRFADVNGRGRPTGLLDGAGNDLALGGVEVYNRFRTCKTLAYATLPGQPF